MSTVATEWNVTHSFAVPDQRFLDALDALDRSATNGFGQVSEKRISERMEFAGNPLVMLDLPDRQPGETGARSVFRVWGRDLSRGGLSFLFDRQAVAISPLQSPTTFDIEAQLRGSKSIAVGLTKADGSHVWLASRILRLRRVECGLFECGVQFERRFDPASETAGQDSDVPDADNA